VHAWDLPRPPRALGPPLPPHARSGGVNNEGKITTDETFGHATYGCAPCCGFDGTYLLPNPMEGLTGGGGSFTVWATNACTGTDVQI
jgi:hypothetical protein